MYDIAVIGLGPAGIEALNLAIKNNLKVIAFEKNKIGGTCLNCGCIPTKAILHCANLYNEIKSSETCAITVSKAKFDWQQIIKRKDDIVSKFNKALDLTYSKNATIINGEAEIIIDNDEVLINCDDNIYQAKNVIIATGSRSIELENLKFDNKNILSSDDVLDLNELPKSMAIVGSGAIGLEIAYFLQSFNVETTIIEKAPNLAPLLDIELQKRVERILKTNKINFYKDDYVLEYKNKTVKLNSNETFKADKMLVAIGRKQILPNISLVQGKCEVDLKINPDCTCDLDNIYVIGDATKQTMLAHSASYQAKIVMNKILGKKELSLKNIPSVIYLTPEIASVGLREQDIINKDEYQIKKILVGSIAKSWCENANDGVIKIIIKDNKIKGAHIVSKNASILISIFNIIINQELSLDEIDEMIFPHPCFSELIQEVVRNGK